MARKVECSWRGDYKEECQAPQGKIETYAGAKHKVAGYGARLLDPKTGTERMYTEFHESRETAAKWLKIALGLCLVVGTALVAIGSIV